MKRRKGRPPVTSSHERYTRPRASAAMAGAKQPSRELVSTRGWFQRPRMRAR